MDEKTLNALEFNKILERLAGYAAFSASAELAQKLRPTSDLEEAIRRQARTREASHLLSIDSDISVGGARDVRMQISVARRQGVLEVEDILLIKQTLIAARTVTRRIEHSENPFPHLLEITSEMIPPPGLVDAISRVISENGEILDNASTKLATIRHDLKISHERLMSRLGSIINDPKKIPLLQESIITQRNGRYVIPLKADFKGRIKSIIHDQSASGSTIFIEPLSVVELNNRWHELQLAERDEMRRILAELTRQIGEHANQIEQLVNALAFFDLILMCAKYAEDLKAVEPILVPFRKQQNQGHPGSTISLVNARHPLLDPKKTVPIDVHMDEQTYSLVITGPNTGGKTVTLKTVGLMVLMAQSGLHIPAKSGSKLSVFRDVFVDIGDEQSIEQSLSTFSAHITNIIRILSGANQYSLVLLDELGAGTDPQEGAVLARGLLDYLMNKQVTNLVATHFPELKAYAHATPGTVNASMEFDAKSLQPTYHLLVGLPGRSNALLIAERLGLPESILEEARSGLHPDDLRTDDLLDEIHRQRDLARKARAEAEESHLEIKKLQDELAERLEKIEDERVSILEKARQQAESELFEVQSDLKALRRQMAQMKHPVSDVREIKEKVSDLEDRLQQPVKKRPVKKRPVTKAVPRPLKVGDRVIVISLKMEGRVSSIERDEVEVQAGALRMRVQVKDIKRPGDEAEELVISRPDKSMRSSIKTPSEPASPFYPSPGVELDLRGCLVDEGLQKMESYLDSAFLAGLPYVRIIHGKGTGRLRTAVRQALRSSPHVKGWQIGLESEGGDGVTVAKLESE
jgi:DNA mismatch repair protein MutS2